MSDRWETLAQQDAEFFIWTDVAKGDDFFASGERDAARILEFAAPYRSQGGAALEIGCGVGRITIPMSRHFERIVAVDVAPTMLRKLGENCSARGIAHVTPMLVTDAWECVTPIRFAYSRIVFQHIADWGQIADHFRRIAAVLAPDGAFYIQFDTRAPTLLYHVRNALPDAVLPRNYWRGVRRIRRTGASIEQLGAANGLEVAAQRGAGTDDTEFVFRRSGS